MAALMDTPSGLKAAPHGADQRDLPEDLRSQGGFGPLKGSEVVAGSSSRPAARPPPRGSENDARLPSHGPSHAGRGIRITMVERLGPEVVIGTDGVQWLVYKRVAGDGILWREACWKPVGFIQSSKAALRDCLRVKGLELDAAGEAALARQPRRIHRWVKG